MGSSINISTLLYFFDKVRNLVSKAVYWIIVDNLTQEGLAGRCIYTVNLTEQVPEKSLL